MGRTEDWQILGPMEEKDKSSDIKRHMNKNGEPPKTEEIIEPED